MNVLANLLQRVPVGKENSMSAAGFVAWVCWQKNLDPAVSQTLQDYGGMGIVTDRDQGLWFFFTSDILLALARLSVWAKFNNIEASIVAFPAKLMLGSKRELGLDVDTFLANQALLPSSNLEIWLHPKVREHGESLPGLIFQEKSIVQGMAKIDWSGLTADPRLPYTSSQGWYAVLRPLGNPLDKLFQAGWRAMYGALEEALKQNKLKFLPHENFVIVQIENLHQLRVLLREFFSVFASAKNSGSDYWPCVSAVVDRKGLNFNTELPTKVGLKWENLTPDFPYISYRNAYLLGENFAVHDIRTAGEHINIDSWCNISLDDSAMTRHALPIMMPGLLMPGTGGCFYCGLGNHVAKECPTLLMPVEDDDPWQAFERLSIDDINEIFRALETTLTELGTEGYRSTLETNAVGGTLLRALFDINIASQLRTAPRIWLSKTKDYPRCLLDMPHPRDNSPVWELLEQLRAASGDKLGKIEKEIQAAGQRFPRDGRLRTLLGFCAVSKGELERALTYFGEGAALTHSTLVQAWNEYLQARILEIQRHYAEAFEQYGNVQRIIPSWTDISYRQIVCKIKLGFGEQTLEQVCSLITSEPKYFNRCLIDPELERGQLLILSTLYPFWHEALSSIELEKARLHELEKQIKAWYPEEHPTSERFRLTVRELIRFADTKNYVACLHICAERPILEKDFAETIQKEVEQLQDGYKRYLAVLQAVRDEASWFPFMNMLVVFNREFNECAGIINWAFSSNFKEPETYKKAFEHTGEIEERLRNLRKRLHFLRIVRDSTLFMLTTGKTFFWAELIGLLLCFFLVPGIVYFGDRVGLFWLQEMLAGQLWEIQKVLVGIVTIMALGVALLRSTLIFEKRRDNLLKKAKEQRERAQQIRLENIKQKRKSEIELKLKAEAEEQKKEQKREFKLR